jgi:hypothetical protein
MTLIDRLKPEVAEQLDIDWLFEMELLEVLLNYRNPTDLPLWAVMNIYSYVRAGEFNFNEYMNLFKDDNIYDDKDESWLFDV